MRPLVTQFASTAADEELRLLALAGEVEGGRGSVTLARPVDVALVRSGCRTR